MEPRTIGKSRWRLLKFLSKDLAGATDPDGNTKLMSKGKLRARRLRHAGHPPRKCKGCDAPLEPGTLAWRSAGDNGTYRSDRFCLACIGEP